MAEFDEQELPADDGFAEPDLNEEVRFGGHCKALINSEGYKKVTKQMRDITLETFETSPMRDNEARTYCRIVLQVLNDMHVLIQDAVDTGTMSAQQLAENAEALKQQQESN
jgi:hypothetical protein